MKNLTTTSVFLLLLVSIASADAAVRKWTDTSGRFQIEAEMVVVKDGIVYLHRPDNDRVVQVPLKRLSKADRDFIAGQQKAEAVGDATEAKQPASENPSKQKADYLDALCMVKRKWSIQGVKPSVVHEGRFPGVLVTADSRGGIVLCDASVVSFHFFAKSEGYARPKSVEFDIFLAAGSAHSRQTKGTLIGISNGMAAFRVDIGKNDRTLDSFPGIKKIKNNTRVTMHGGKGQYSSARKITLVSRTAIEGSMARRYLPDGTIQWTVMGDTPSHTWPAPAIIAAGDKVVGLRFPKGRFLAQNEIKKRLFPMVGSVRLYPKRWGPKGVEFDILADIIDPVGAASKPELLFGLKPSREDFNKLRKLGLLGELAAKGAEVKAAAIENLLPASVSSVQSDRLFFVYPEDVVEKVGTWVWKDAFGPAGKSPHSKSVEAGFVARLRWKTSSGETMVSDPLQVGVDLLRARRKHVNKPKSPLRELYRAVGVPGRFHRDGGLIVTSPDDTALNEMPLPDELPQPQASSALLSIEKHPLHNSKVVQLQRTEIKGADPEDWRVPASDSWAISADDRKMYTFFPKTLMLHEIDWSDPKKPVEKRLLDLSSLKPAAIKDRHGREVDPRISVSLRLTSDFLVAIISGRYGAADRLDSQLVLIDPTTLKIKRRLLAFSGIRDGRLRWCRTSSNYPYLINAMKGSLRVVDPRSGKCVRRTRIVDPLRSTTRCLHSIVVSLDGRTAVEPRNAILFRLDGPDLIFQRMAKPMVVKRGRSVRPEFKKTLPDIFDKDEADIIMNFKGDDVVLNAARITLFSRKGWAWMLFGWKKPSDDKSTPLEHIKASTPSDQCVPFKKVEGYAQSTILVFLTRDMRLATKYLVPGGCGAVLRRGNMLLFPPSRYPSNSGDLGYFFALELPEAFDPPEDN